MIWFGSSAGVAITNKFPEGRNVLAWVRNGWHIAVAYVIGFFALLFILGWHPTSNNEHKHSNERGAAECVSPNCKSAIKARYKASIPLTPEQQKYLDKNPEIVLE